VGAASSSADTKNDLNAICKLPLRIWPDPSVDTHFRHGTEIPVSADIARSCLWIFTSYANIESEYDVECPHLTPVVIAGRRWPCQVPLGYLARSGDWESNGYRSEGPVRVKEQESGVVNLPARADEAQQTRGERRLRVQMDEADWAILGQLGRDPHVSAREIAENIGATVNNVVARLRKLDRLNAFHVTAALSLKALGQTVCFVFAEVRGVPVAAVAREVCLIPEVILVCASIGHDTNLIITFRYSDDLHLAEVLHRKIASINGLHRFTTSTVLETPLFNPLYMNFTPKSLIADADKLASEIQDTYSEDLINDTDARIVAELQQDGRRSIPSIARKLGLKPGTVRYRIRALETRGLIHFVTLLNPEVSPHSRIALVTIDVEANSLDALITKLSGRVWLPQLFVCAGCHRLIGVVLADRFESLIDLKSADIEPIAGVLRVQLLPLLRVFKIDARWAQKANQA
jgi:DNA-binding Lrp family transcriptional regulator